MLTQILSVTFISLFVITTSAQDTTSARPTVVTLGDSITKGVRSGVSNKQTFSAILDRELNHDTLNLGIGGERTDQALKRLDDAVIRLQPQFVLVMYGTNDSYVDQGKSKSRITVNAYRDNLTQIVNKLLLAGIEPILMTPPRWAPDARANGVNENPNLSLAVFAEACRSVAIENELPLIDHYSHWTSAESNGRDLNTWTTDGCHPNPAGHAEMAKLILVHLRGIRTPNTELESIELQLETVIKPLDPSSKSLWFHPRVRCGNRTKVVMTAQKLICRTRQVFVRQ
ncbi:MAG: GDSL-type esterase/lipase family protein [Mariniblastus sp.]|nr:GDSL-type esterase/lipase family protein [Mariniblastus sp.]